MGNGDGMDRERSLTQGAQAGQKRHAFYGAYNHSIDAKGRMIVPQSFREKLGEKIVVGVNTAQSSIAIYPMDVWERRIQMLTELAEEDVSAEVFLERFAMLSFDNIGFDPQGRVLIPAALRELFIKDASGVQVSGAHDYVRVVSSEQAAEAMKRFHEEHPDILGEISLIQARIRAKRAQQ